MSNNVTLLDLLFGAYRQRVLGLLLLQPDQRFHVREIARQTGKNAGTLHRELAKLAETGLLLRETQGNQVLYGANRACPVFDELAGLLRKTSGAAAVLRTALQPLESHIMYALVFGSLARGTQNFASDVDVLVVGDADFAEVVRALYSAQETLNREINPVVYSSTECQKRAQADEPLIREILANPMLFLIGDEHDFREFAGHP